MLRRFVTGISFACTTILAASAQHSKLVHDCFQAPSSEPETVIARCTSVINAAPSRSIYDRALNRRGLAYARLNRKNDALRDFDALIADNKTSAGYFDNRREVLRALGKFDQALSDANNAIRLSPSLAYVYHGRADVLFDMGRFDLAITDYTTAFSKKDAFIWSIFNRGRAHANLKQLLYAIQDFTKVLEADPGISSALKERGFAYLAIGQYDKAQSDLQVFLQREPADPEARQALLDLESRSGAPQRAPEAGAEKSPIPSHSSTGTGVFVSAKHVLTNNHVTADCGSNPIMVSYPDQRPEPAYVSGRDETNDLILLRTELPNKSAASFRLRPRVGEFVAAYGFPFLGLLSSSGNFTLGNITSLTGIGDDTRLLQTSAPIQPGNSGGPLLDMRGTVVGIIESQLNSVRMAERFGTVPQNVNFAIQTAIVINFLSIKGVFPQLAENEGSTLQPADVAEIAKTFTVRVNCGPN